jgi:hypothetical protein
MSDDRNGAGRRPQTVRQVLDESEQSEKKYRGCSAPDAMRAMERDIDGLRNENKEIRRVARDAAEHAEQCDRNAAQVVSLISRMAFGEPGHTVDQCEKLVMERWAWLGSKKDGFDRHLKLTQAMLLLAAGAAFTVFGQAIVVHLGWLGK